MDNILRQHGLDPEKVHLGKLCTRGHEWGRTGQSIRYNKNSKLCVDCARENARKSGGSQTTTSQLTAKRAEDEYWEQNQVGFLSQYLIDTEKFRLGQLCKRKHGFAGTGRSLRRVPGNNCRDCGFERNGTPIPEPDAALKEIAILKENHLDPDKFRLGIICPSSHDWKGTGKTLKYRSNGACIECLGYQQPGRVINDIETKFWMHVNKIDDEDSCWDWTGSKLTQGYGRVGHGYKTTKAHRLSYELANGPIPDGMVVCHKCDRPSCVRPSHLFLGTSQDNIADMVGKGRNVMGSRSPHAKLTEEDIPDVWERYRNGESKASIARHYNVSPGCIAHVIKGRNWTHAS